MTTMQNNFNEKGERPLHPIFSDRSLWFLLFSNFVTILIAVKEGWNLSIVMWVYWFQSVAIGFFNFIRILLLKEFSTEGVKINDKPVQPTQSTKIFIAFFFLVHYGFFHLVYSIFLSTAPFIKSYGKGLDSAELNFFYLTALLFFITHLFSYIYNRPRDTKKQNIGALMMYPYARIIPMHLTIMFGGAFFTLSGSSFGGAFTLLLFLMLKTLADGIMHTVEHKVIRKGEAR